MNPTSKKRSGAPITHAYWRSSEKSTRMMFSGASHVLAMRDGKLLVICFVRCDEPKFVSLESSQDSSRKSRLSRKFIEVSKRQKMTF